MFNLAHSAEQTDLADALRQMGQRAIRPVMAHGGKPAEGDLVGVWRDLHGMGLTAPVGADHGGQGSPDATTAMLIAEEIGFGDPGVGYDLVCRSRAALMIDGLGNADQRDTYLPRLVRDPGFGAGVCYFEGFGRSPLELRTTARRIGDRWEISGHKIGAIRPATADLQVVVAADAESGEPLAFVVEPVSVSGLTVVRDDGAVGKLGADAAVTGNVELRGVTVPDTAVLTGSADVPLALHRSIAALRLAVGAVLLGAARAALAYAADYANTRVAFGQPIAQYQGVAFPLVEVDIEVDATRLLLWRAAAAVESTTDLDVIVGRTSEVVARCQRTALEAGRIGVNTLGGSVDRKGRRGVSIDFDLNLGARALLSDVRDWALAEGRAIARQCDDAHVVPDEVASRVLKTCPLDTSPLLGVDVDFGVDKEFALGERDGSNTLGVRFSELAAYGDMSLILLLKGSGIGGRVVDLLGTDEQIDKWSGGLDRGEYHSTGFALTEPSCGSDATALTTTVVRDGDNWVLNGSKVFCSNGNAADFIIVFATVDRTLGHKGIRAFVVPRSTPGLSVPRPNEEKLGVRSMVTSQLVLDDVVLPLDHCLGDPGREDGFRTAMNTLNSTRPHATSFAVGIGQAAHDYAREHLTARRSEFTATRWDRIDNELRRMNAALDRGRLMVGRAAWLMDQGISNLREASQAKAYACPLAEHICVRAMVLMGADGYSKEHLVEKWYRDIKIMDIWEGAGNIQKLVVSRQLQRGGPSRF